MIMKTKLNYNNEKGKEMSKSENSTSIMQGFYMWSLFLVFLVLKLTNVISWSWWWVTAPLWGGFGVFLLVLAILGIIYACVKG